MATTTAAHQTAQRQRADHRRTATGAVRHGAGAQRAGIGNLQRTLGNSGMNRLLRSGALQARLAVGPVDDQYEREAESVADDVMRMPATGADIARRPAPAVQRLCAECDKEQEEEEVQRAPVAIQRACPACEEEHEVQRAPLGLQRACSACEEEKIHRAPVQITRMCTECAEEQEKDDEERDVVQALREGSSHPEASTGLESYIAGSRGGGQPLPQPTRDHFETRFGHDFGGVRVHTDTRAADAAAEIDAHAFATGSDIHFGAGRFQPGTPQGDHLLAHELTHTIQQTGGSPMGQGGAISRAAAGSVQRWPSASDVLDSLEETVDDAADVAEGAIDTVGGAVSDAVDTAGEELAAAGEAVSSAAGEVADTAVAAGEAVAEAGEEALDWLATEAGQLAMELADALGVSVIVTADGLEIRVPEVCPLDAVTEGFDLGSIDGEFMVPIVAIPIGTVAITGEVGVAGHIEPRVEVQLGPICLNGLRILINPITGAFSISGSVSATAAASIAAELRGGLRGAVGVKGVVPIGGVPVPIDVPVAGLEGGIAGLVRGIGAGTLTIGGSLGVGAGGTISIRQTQQLDLGLAADLFVGAYGQLDVLGENICRIYWQPIEWHGDVAGSIGITLGVTVTPGGRPVVVPVISPPTFGQIPFSQIPLALSREGFSDDCAIIDAICEVLSTLGLLPSQNGGEWNWGGPYGPGPRLAGPLEVYQRNPGIPSKAECRGACGPDCDTCEPSAIYRIVDPLTGDTWEYLNFEDCNMNEGCREHDAAFDWAAAIHGETGKWAIVMPWHMAANIECACNNLAGNCIAWIAGLPPYDGKIFFADASMLVAPGGRRGLTAGSCRADFPNAPDCLASFPDRDMVLEEWGQRNRIENFRDCAVAADFTRASTVDCDGGPGNYWNCRATDAVTGQEVVVGLFECICCNDDDTASSMWMEPHIVVDPTTMSDELILELCDRNLIPRVICIPFEEEMIGRFGGRGRDLEIDPDTDPKSRLRPDDAPLIEGFKRIYNRLESWVIFIETNHPELKGEFDTEFKVDLRREEWLKQIKEAGEAFKKKFRDIGRTDPEDIKEEYKKVLADIEKDVDGLNRKIAAWYQGKTGTPGTIDEIIEDVHRQGTELWRAAWRRAILQVNRVLALLWPPAKRQLLFWLGQTRARHPDKDLSGSVSELDYLGSLSGGFKGPPKQNIRFNPESFDVDGFVEAPPLAKYAMFVMVPPVKPKHGNIFAKNTDIEPLKTFSAEAQQALVARVDGYKDDPADPFDVAIKTEDLPEQARGKAATERLYELREKLPPDEYRKMVEELRQGGFLTPDGSAIREELTEAEAEAVKRIMDKFDSPAPPQVPRTA